MLIIVALLAALAPTTASASTSPVLWTKLMVGKEFVGEVNVEHDGNYLYVEYKVYTHWGGYCLLETNLHVATTLEGIPQANGNPLPGQFDYKGEHNCVREVTYKIPLDGWVPSVEKPLYIAAHSVVGNINDPEVEETGWGVRCGNLAKYAFPGNNWAAYILYPR